MFTCSVDIHVVDHILQLSLSRILTEGPHDCVQLLGGHSAVTARMAAAPLPCEDDFMDGYTHTCLFRAQYSLEAKCVRM